MHSAALNQGEYPLKVRAVSQHRGTEDEDVFSHWMETGRGWRGPHQPTLEFENIVGLHLHITTDGIENEIKLGAEGGKVFRRVIDHAFSAQGANIIVIRFAGRGGDVGAEMSRELNGEATHAARAAMDQDVFAGLQLPGVLDGPRGRQPYECNRGGLGMRQATGFAGDDGGRDNQLFCVGSLDTAIKHAENGVAHGEFLHARSHGADDSREVASQYVRKMDWIRPLATTDFVIRTVHACGVDIDENLSRFCFRVGHFADIQDVGWTESIKQYSLHLLKGNIVAAVREGRLLRRLASPISRVAQAAFLSARARTRGMTSCAKASCSFKGWNWSMNSSMPTSTNSTMRRATRS